MAQSPRGAPPYDSVDELTKKIDTLVTIMTPQQPNSTANDNRQEQLVESLNSQLGAIKNGFEKQQQLENRVTTIEKNESLREKPLTISKVLIVAISVAATASVSIITILALFFATKSDIVQVNKDLFEQVVKVQTETNKEIGLIKADIAKSTTNIENINQNISRIENNMNNQKSEFDRKLDENASKLAEIYSAVVK